MFNIDSLTDNLKGEIRYPMVGFYQLKYRFPLWYCLPYNESDVIDFYKYASETIPTDEDSICYIPKPIDL